MEIWKIFLSQMVDSQVPILVFRWVWFLLLMAEIPNNHLVSTKPCLKKYGINCQPQLVSRISEPSTGSVWYKYKPIRTKIAQFTHLAHGPRSEPKKSGMEWRAYFSACHTHRAPRHTVSNHHEVTKKKSTTKHHKLAMVNYSKWRCNLRESRHDQSLSTVCNERWQYPEVLHPQILLWWMLCESFTFLGVLSVCEQR